METILSGNKYSEKMLKALISHAWTAFPTEFKQDFSLRSEHVLFCDIHNKLRLEHERPDFTILTNPAYWNRHYVVEGKIELTVAEIRACLENKYYVQRYEDVLSRNNMLNNPTALVFVGKTIVAPSEIKAYLKSVAGDRPTLVFDFGQFAEWLFSNFSNWATAREIDAREVTGVRYALEQELSELFPDRKVLADDHYRSTQAKRLNSGK